MGAGGEETIWKSHRVCVGEGCESKRKRELAMEREREEERGRERGCLCAEVAYR